MRIVRRVVDLEGVADVVRIVRRLIVERVVGRLIVERAIERIVGRLVVERVVDRLIVERIGDVVRIVRRRIVVRILRDVAAAVGGDSAGAAAHVDVAQIDAAAVAAGARAAMTTGSPAAAPADARTAVARVDVQGVVAVVLRVVGVLGDRGVAAAVTGVRLVDVGGGRRGGVADGVADAGDTAGGGDRGVDVAAGGDRSGALSRDVGVGRAVVVVARVVPLVSAHCLFLCLSCDLDVVGMASRCLLRYFLLCCPGTGLTPSVFGGSPGVSPVRVIRDRPPGGGRVRLPQERYRPPG